MILCKCRFVLLFLSLSIIFSDPGDLVSYDYQENIGLSTIETGLTIIGGGLGLSPPVYTISIYDIRYETELNDGSIDTLSGLVSIPNSTSLAFPTLSYHHGTTTLDNEAPSNTGLSFSNLEVMAVGLLGSPSGFITIFPDYEGLGDPNKFHPYHIKDSYTHSIVNMIRAVKNLSHLLEGDESFQYNEQLFLIGYSEGGYATLASQCGIELDYDEEFEITASFPMAGAYDLSGTMVDYFLSEPTYENPYYVPYVLTSHIWYYQGLDTDLNEYFEPYWAENLPILYDGTHSGGEINGLLPDNVLDILKDSVLTDFTINEQQFLRQTLEMNTFLDWVPQSPTYLLHGIGDDQVPYANSQVAYDLFQSNGSENVNLQILSEATGGHVSSFVPCFLSAYGLMTDYQLINEKGDMDADGELSLTDQVYLSALIINDMHLTEFQKWLGDCNYDNERNVIDILTISDILIQIEDED